MEAMRGGQGHLGGPDPGPLSEAGRPGGRVEVGPCRGYNNGHVKDTLWVSARSTLGLCVFPNIFAVYACKLT